MTQHSGLKITNLAYAYETSPLFENLSFEVFPKQALQIVGSNGKGKTTLLKLLVGLLTPLQGEIFWNGQCVRRVLENYRINLAYLGHHIGLKGYLTVRENLLLSAQLKGYSLNENSLLKILEQTGLTKQANQLTYQLSAGEKQRLALLRLATSFSQVWVLDEPFSVLCQEGQALIAHLIQQHLSNQGVVIFTSHHTVNLGKVTIETVAL